MVYTYVDCKFRRKEKRGARIIPGFSWKKMTEERSKLIEDNLMFAYSMANKFCGVPIEYDDLIGIANYGLVKAAQKFDYGAGYSFTTYAGKVISNEILQFLRKQKKHLYVLSLEEPIQDTENITLEDTIADKEDGFGEVEAIMVIQSSIDYLNDREFSAVALSIDLPGVSQAQRAKKLGVSQSIYSRYLSSAKRKIRACFFKI